MAKYIAGRLVLMVPIMIGITVVTFLLVNVLPGDPLQAIIGENFEINLSPETIAAFRERYGLNDPLPIQYLHYVARVAQGDLGRSYASDQPVIELVVSRIPATLILAGSSLVISMLISIPLGILSAVRRGSWIDAVSVVFATVGVSMPSFWLGLLLILAFALGLRWLPTSGSGTGTLDQARHLILPALTLGAAGAGLLTRFIRSSLIEVLDLEYIVTARAKGLRERLVLSRHAIKNAAIPVVTLLGVQVGALLSGAVIVETIFAWPGIGRLALDSILKHDLPVVQGVVLLSSIMFLIANLLVDVSYGLLDPRIRLSTRS